MGKTRLSSVPTINTEKSNANPTFQESMDKIIDVYRKRKTCESLSLFFFKHLNFRCDLSMFFNYFVILC